MVPHSEGLSHSGGALLGGEKQLEDGCVEEPAVIKLLLDELVQTYHVWIIVSL